MFLFFRQSLFYTLFFYIKGSRSLANISLTNLYIRLNQYEEAKNSLLKAYQFRSPFADRTFKYLQKSLKKAGLDTLKFDIFLKNSKEELFPKAPSYVLPSKIPYNIADSNDILTFFIFLSGSCSPCDDPVFNAIDILNSFTEINKNILVFAKDKQLVFFKDIYENVYPIKINNEILKKFNVKKLPVVIVVKNGRINSIDQNISTNENAWLNYLGLF